jgi:hypothetical protein
MKKKNGKLVKKMWMIKTKYGALLHICCKTKQETISQYIRWLAHWYSWEDLYADGNRAVQVEVREL